MEQWNTSEKVIPIIIIIGNRLRVNNRHLLAVYSMGMHIELKEAVTGN